MLRLNIGVPLQPGIQKLGRSYKRSFLPVCLHRLILVCLSVVYVSVCIFIIYLPICLCVCLIIHSSEL